MRCLVLHEVTRKIESRYAIMRFFAEKFQLSGKGKSGKLESSRKEADEGKDDDLEENYSPQFLAKENEQLRHRLEEEASNYRRRMETYRQAQQHQATLVSRLQAKVMTFFTYPYSGVIVYYKNGDFV